MNYYNYQRSGDIIEIRIKDSTGRSTGKFRFNSCDKDQSRKVIEYLKKKYGIDGNIPEADFDELKQAEAGEIDWNGLQDI